MKLTDAAVGEFARIAKNDYGIELSESDARQEAEALMNFAYSLLHSPSLMSKEK